MRAYADADVLIWHLLGNREALRLLRQPGVETGHELWIGAMQRAEVIFFMRPEEEEQTMLFLSQFKTAPVTQEIMDDAGKLHRQWHPSHGLDISDAILAATALQTGGQVFCLNVKHYPMPGFPVKKAW